MAPALPLLQQLSKCGPLNSADSILEGASTKLLAFRFCLDVAGPDVLEMILHLEPAPVTGPSPLV